jgi:hypothetical protein
VSINDEIKGRQQAAIEHAGQHGCVGRGVPCADYQKMMDEVVILKRHRDQQFRKEVRRINDPTLNAAAGMPDECELPLPPTIKRRRDHERE